MDGGGEGGEDELGTVAGEEGADFVAVGLDLVAFFRGEEGAVADQQEMGLGEGAGGGAGGGEVGGAAFGVAIGVVVGDVGEGGEEVVEVGEVAAQATAC